MTLEEDDVIAERRQSRGRAGRLIAAALVLSAFSG